MKKFMLLMVALLLTGCAAIPRPGRTPTPMIAPPYDAWARVLEKFVDGQGRINFSAAAKDRADLDRFVAYVYDVGPNNQPQLFPTPDHVLAYHLNAYNALAMHKVIETGIPQTLAGTKKIGFFYLGKMQVGGVPISLYDYENKVIRPLGEPRIHVALNCMSVGCPRLPREPFLPEKLNAQLDREARLFFAEARNVSLSDDAKILRLSEILQFYTEDFLAKAPSLAAYVNRYRNAPVSEAAKVEFMPYDWTINRQPGS
ncbi:MAG: DUF547 domain-containing protein [Usitatibacteraceae bacterium]